MPDEPHSVPSSKPSTTMGSWPIFTIILAVCFPMVTLMVPWAPPSPEAVNTPSCVMVPTSPSTFHWACRLFDTTARLSICAVRLICCDWPGRMVKLLALGLMLVTLLGGITTTVVLPLA